MMEFGIPWETLAIFAGVFILTEIFRPHTKIKPVVSACLECRTFGNWKTCTHSEYVKTGLFGKTLVTTPPTEHWYEGQELDEANPNRVPKVRR